MERRKILLGSGTALATVLAGCSSDETGSDSNDNDESTDGETGDNGDSSDETDVPGLDRDKLKLDSEKITIKDVSKDGDTVDIVATTTTTDPETLAAALDVEESVAMRNSRGGPAPDAMADHLSRAREELAADRETVETRREAVQRAHEGLREEVASYA